MRKYLSKKSLQEYKKIYKENGFKALLKKIGWRVLLLIFIFYLIRDVILYVIGPMFLFDFLLILGLEKIVLYPFFIFLFIFFLIFLIHGYNKDLRLKIFRTATFLGFCAILLGAFGTHGLKDVLENFDTKEIYRTASLYHFYIVFFIFFMGLMQDYISRKYLKIGFYLSLIGLFIFSGSLYFLSVTNIQWVGSITPIGGLFFLCSFSVIFLGFKLKKI